MPRWRELLDGQLTSRVQRWQLGNKWAGVTQLFPELRLEQKSLITPLSSTFHCKLCARWRLWTNSDHYCWIQSTRPHNPAQESNAVVRVSVQHHLFSICHLRESSARFTKQWQPRAPVLIGSLPAERFSPCPFALSPRTRRLQPLDGWEGLKGSLGFYFCSLCRLPHITVPPQQDWPRGSNTLTAHKQQQGLQMTTCHWPGCSHLQLTKHFQ